MTDRTPKRPWWRKRRWIAAGLFWLFVAYPLSAGPAVYGVSAGHLPRDALLLYSPVRAVALRTPLRRPWIGYKEWWGRLAPWPKNTGWGNDRGLADWYEGNDPFDGHHSERWP